MGKALIVHDERAGVTFTFPNGIKTQRFNGELNQAYLDGHMNKPKTEQQTEQRWAWNGKRWVKK
jgi:hypothetical protein